MTTLELQVYTIKEKRPNDGAACWVNPKGHYLQQLIYNENYDCWDDAEGDDCYCNVNEEDVWIELPSELKV